MPYYHWHAANAAVYESALRSGISALDIVDVYFLRFLVQHIDHLGLVFALIAFVEGGLYPTKTFFRRKWVVL